MQQRRARQQWRANYSTPEYRANRKEALRRDGWRCIICGRGKVEGVRLEVDHIVAIVDGGSNAASNLVTLCEQHHRAKTREDRALRKKNH